MNEKPSEAECRICGHKHDIEQESGCCLVCGVRYSDMKVGETSTYVGANRYGPKVWKKTEDGWAFVSME